MPLRLLADQFSGTRANIGALTKDIRREAETSDAAKRLRSIPGIGPITATALAATLPDVTGFRTSRDLSAWLGLTPKPHSGGGGKSSACGWGPRRPRPSRPSSCAR
uniref:transposase n=1 Tax=Mangrovicoccus ximenensis TaxID=1911570 RepID=UPI001374BA44